MISSEAGNDQVCINVTWYEGHNFRQMIDGLKKSAKEANKEGYGYFEFRPDRIDISACDGKTLLYKVRYQTDGLVYLYNCKEEFIQIIINLDDLLERIKGCKKKDKVVLSINKLLQVTISVGKKDNITMDTTGYINNITSEYMDYKTEEYDTTKIGPMYEVSPEKLKNTYELYKGKEIKDVYADLFPEKMSLYVLSPILINGIVTQHKKDKIVEWYSPFSLSSRNQIKFDVTNFVHLKKLSSMCNSPIKVTYEPFKPIKMVGNLNGCGIVELYMHVNQLSIQTSI